MGWLPRKSRGSRAAEVRWRTDAKRAAARLGVAGALIDLIHDVKDRPQTNTAASRIIMRLSLILRPATFGGRPNLMTKKIGNVLRASRREQPARVCSVRILANTKIP